MRLKIKPNSVRIRSLSCQISVLPSTGFELTPLIHCSTIRLALCPPPQTTRPHTHIYCILFLQRPRIIYTTVFRVKRLSNLTIQDNELPKPVKSFFLFSCWKLRGTNLSEIVETFFLIRVGFTCGLYTTFDIFQHSFTILIYSYKIHTWQILIAL